jgi:hypothetical protein
MVLDPLENTPVSNEPSVAVSEWSVPSWLVTVMVSPTLAVAGSGTNLNPLIVILPAVAAGAAVVDDEAAPVVLDPADEADETVVVVEAVLLLLLLQALAPKHKINAAARAPERGTCMPNLRE